MRVRLCAVVFEKYEWISALPMAKVKVAVRKSSPTRTAVFLVDGLAGPLCCMVGAVTVPNEVAVVGPIDRSSVAVFMVTPMVGGLRCK
jgi:hypothetical protein